MQYQSTRDKNLKASSAQAVLNGLAPDGGLYTMPSFDEARFDYREVLDLDTFAMSAKILSKLLTDFSEEEMAKLVREGYAGKFETKNAAFMGRGLCFNKYTGSRGKGGSNDADAEYVALVRDIMDEAGVDFQTCELGRVNAGGGGTIAYIMAKYGMNVIDSGVAVLSMHALWEVANKADIYEAYRGYKAFIERA